MIGGGFEPTKYKTASLQLAPFGRLDTLYLKYMINNHYNINSFYVDLAFN
jgi:hypothetical protein